MERYDRPTLDAIYDILIRSCGAPDDEDIRTQFVWNAERFESPWAFEFRFQGFLGFGGKIWLYNGEYPYVNCYREDETPERTAAIAKANEELRTLIRNRISR